VIYLIEYNRTLGQVVSLREFEDMRRHDAAESRLAIELELNQNQVDHEVVLLEAEDKAALLRTHQRYFVGLKQILIHGTRNGGQNAA
jgi:hypothetical protein